MSLVSTDIAIVTGVSHSKGIGAAICKELAKKGVHIFFTHWLADQDWVLSFQQQIVDLGVKCSHLEVDFSKPDSYEKVLDKAQLDLGNPTILVNNAAYSTRDGYLKLDAKTLDEHYAVNMRTVFLLAVEFARRFKSYGHRRGSIINMTSGQGQGPMPEELAYGATKGAISAFTVTLSAELAPLGITVNAINPGPTDTGWMTDDIKTELEPKFLLGRVGQPEDAARLVSFLVSEEGQWITGQVINSEGGFLRG